MFRSFDLFKRGRSQEYTKVTPQEVERRLHDGEQLLVLDVREPHEFRQGHIVGSTLIPLNQLSLRIDELPRERPIVAICRSGNRSGVAAGLLTRAGFQDVSNLTGGITRWQQQGLPVERGK